MKTKFTTDMNYELAIILPTYNEADNILILLTSLGNTLRDILWEAIVVDDDSPDNTSDIVINYIKDKQNMRCFQRKGQRGLSSAVIDGMMRTKAEYIAVMDTDLQHDESLLIKMLHEIKDKQLDLVIGSRFLINDKNDGFSERRNKISNIGTYLARKIIDFDIKDPLSGYFMLKNELINEVSNSLTGIGYKILLDILTCCKDDLKYKELQFTFRKRLSGNSKLNLKIMLQFLYMLFIKKYNK